jgi:hypothetical protein
MQVASSILQFPTDLFLQAKRVDILILRQRQEKINDANFGQGVSSPSGRPMTHAKC